MSVHISKCVSDTVNIGEKLGLSLKNKKVIAYFGSMGMGKTAFTHGLAKGLGLDEKMVSSPTFALVHEYKNNNIKLYHFDMYRITSWDDLYSTGYFDYLDAGDILAVEWSENIENALPDDAVKVIFKQGNDVNERIIEIVGVDLI